MINLQQLRVLLAVKEHGSLTRAADALHYGVPTVTHHLRMLEAHLQAELTSSGHGGTRLTPVGVSFAVAAEQVIARIDQAERAVADQRGAGVVTLRVGTFASIGSRLLPSAIAELQKRSSVRVEVVEAEPTDVVRMLRDDEVHAGLIYDVADLPIFDSPDLVLDRLLAEPFQVLVSTHSSWAEQEVLDFNDLTEVPWVFSRSDNEASDRVLRRVYRALGHEARQLMRTDDLYMIHGLVEQGLGLALSTEAAVDTDFDVVLKPARQELGERHVSFVRRRHNPPPAVTWLRALLQTEVARLAGPARHSGTVLHQVCN